MTAPVRYHPVIFPAFRNCSLQLKGAVAALLFVLPFLGSHAFAQTTTISGTVYDPRTTANSLPLPNVLVYVTTGPVAPLPSGVQCLTSSNSTPTGVVAFTYTAVDGTFEMGNIPVNGAYTVVIQAGKWRRQFSETVGAGPLTGLALHMPADHTQGDIPMIAIATGSVDALECVLRDMGLSDTEFTDDNGTVNPGGHIHLYKGTEATGAVINASTPSQSSLMNSPTLMNSYDMVMFPCQGNPAGQATATGATNLLSYANAGGRIFGTHYSYAWLDPASPYYSLFPPVVNWAVNQPNPTPDPGIATINTGFTDGATMAQWLQNAGASYQNTPGQIQISTLRHDFNGVIAPTQSWLTLNNPTAGNPVMQFTFNTPVAAAASSQCGRVVFNEYHVFNASSANVIFPNECPSTASMSAQAEMLEFALFDLSSFVTPVVVPTLSISFNPSPMIVKGGDSADQVTVNVANTSSNTEVFSSVVLTLTLPPGLTATALADSTGGWTCTVGTLTCTRTTSIAASASDSVTLTVSVPAYGAGSPTTGLITATASSPNFSSNVTATDNVIFQQTPAVTWATPASIVYGTALSGTQLNASSPVAGSFSYSPSAGTVLSVGQHTLTATFTPTDTTDYTIATATVTLTVVPASPSVTLTSNANPVFLSNAVTFTASIPSYATPPTGTVTFYDGATQIGTGAMTSGSATFTTTALSTQVHSITAVYSGDTSYGPATSGALSEKVMDFTLDPVGSGKATAPAAGVASYSLVIMPVGGPTLPGAMTLSVTGLSLGATPVFSPATVTAGSGTTTVTLQVRLPGKAAMRPPAKPFSRGPLSLALCLILLPFAGRLRKTARRWQRLAVLALVGAALAVGLNGCGGNTKFNPQSYSLTVTAASGPLSHSTSLSLTVQ
jgi:Bacterial Ig-like domain (group 3)